MLCDAGRNVHGNTSLLFFFSTENPRLAVVLGCTAQVLALRVLLLFRLWGAAAAERDRQTAADMHLLLVCLTRKRTAAAAAVASCLF